MKKVFASDFDGTLYFYKAADPDKLPQESVEKIREYQEAGHLFGLCTGRQVGGLTPFITGLVEPDFFITSSGANIVDRHYEEIRKRGIDPAVAKAIVDLLQPKGFRMTLDVGGDICVFEEMDYPGKYYVISSVDDLPEGLIHQVSAHTESLEEAAAGAAATAAAAIETETGKGTFYGVSVGPGDCGHLTLNAVQTIMHCPVITAPQTKNEGMVAWDIAKAGISRFLELSFGSRMAEASDESFWAAKTILPLSFPMTKVESVRKASYRNAADAIEAYLDKGLDVAMLNLGDVSIYATCQYVADLLKADGYEVKFVPGVTSFCAAASTLGTSLTEADTPVFIIPGAADSEQVDRLLDEYGTKVLMKTVRTLPETLDMLKEKGFSDSTSVVVNCGLPGEQKYPNLLEFEDALMADLESVFSYFTILIVRSTEETK